MRETFSWPGPSGAGRLRESKAPPNGLGRPRSGRLGSGRPRSGMGRDPHAEPYADPYDAHEPYSDGFGPRGQGAADHRCVKEERSGSLFGPEDDDMIWDGPEDFDEACANGKTPGTAMGRGFGMDAGRNTGRRMPYLGVSEEEYQRKDLTNREKAWFMTLGCLDIVDDLDSCVEELFRAPRTLRRTADYGFLGGLVVGRLLALDHYGKPHVKRLLEKVYGLVEPWTVFNPSAAGFLLATFSPQVVYALLLFWPEEYTPYRTFYAAALMGLYLENMPGTDFLHGEAAVNLYGIIDSQRTEGRWGLI